MSFENIPIRSNGDTFQAAWVNTIRAFLVDRFSGYEFSSGVTIANNQSTAQDVTGLLLDESEYTYRRIEYRIKRSTDTPTSYYEVGVLHCWHDGSTWNLRRTVELGNALGDGAGSETGDYQVGGSDSLSITSGGQVQYLSNNMSGGSYAGTIDWKITNSWAA